MRRAEPATISGRSSYFPRKKSVGFRAGCARSVRPDWRHLSCKPVGLGRLSEVRMPLLEARPVELLWDELRPIETGLMPADLVGDRLFDDPLVLAPMVAHGQRESEQRGRTAARHGRPTIPMGTYIRLMVVKQRAGWGYERLRREVSDSLHLRRFCRIALDARGAG